jgi:protein-S-isoprenylcysteine O-methyltransferase Ste14
MIFSILKEEKYLAIEFPEYKNYQKDTWRIIPFVF